MDSATRGLSLSRINEITIRINSSMDLHGLLTTIMDTARELLYTEAASLLLYDAETDELIFDIARGASGNLLARRRIKAGQGIAGACANEKQPIIVNNAAADARVYRGIDKEIGFQTRNILAVPMLAGGQMIGVLETVNTLDERNYSRSDVRLLQYLSNMAALAIRNRRLYEDVRERVDELNCIYEISERTKDKDTVDDLLSAVLESLHGVLGASRLSVILRDVDLGEARIAKTYGFTVRDHDLRIDPEEGIAGIVFRTGDPLLVRDMEKDQRMAPLRGEQYATGSFISVPIAQGDRIIGLLNAADKRNEAPFDYFELKVMRTVAAQVADALGRIAARERDLQLQMYRKDLDTAAMIQRNSLPQIPARVGGLDVATRYEACREVGGDFYDLVYHSEDRISLMMADVAGKGVPAALFMEYSKTVLGSQIPRNLDPVTSLTRANREMCRSSNKMGIFVTCMLLQVERDMRRMRMASAGHNHQILWRSRSRELEILSAPGAPLAIFEDTEYLERIVDYDPGDLLMLYTDGITEATDETYAEFGEERLFELVRAHAAESSPAQIVDAVIEDVNRFRRGFEASDDATLMVVRLR